MTSCDKQALTPRTCEMVVNGRNIRFLNQRSSDWTHLYEYEHSGATLSHAGCGIFSLCHAVEYLKGIRIDPEALADFSCAHGGRGEDGTDRPTLLKAMTEAGLDKQYGFSYGLEGNIDDREALWDCLTNGGAALCNLRVGHITALIGARASKDGERQVLAIDPLGESADERVRDCVREVLPQSIICYCPAGANAPVTSYGLFWVPLERPMHFNLLHKRS